MNQQPTQRGGPGRGQGRKPKPPEERYKSFAFRFPPDVVEWLQQQPNKTAAVVAAIREKISQPGGTDRP